MILSAVRGDLAVSSNGELTFVLPESRTAEVEALVGDGDLATALREAGFTVMVDDTIVEARLLEHPGHSSQKVHGRRGGGGDSAAVDRSVDLVKAEIRNMPVERMNIITDTGQIIRGEPGTRTESMISTSAVEVGVVQIHNHPDDAAPSPQDLHVFGTPAREIIVVSPVADYSIKPGPDGWGDEMNYRQIATNVYGRVAMDPWKTGAQKSMEFWEQVAPQMGWEFTRTPVTGASAPSPGQIPMFTTNSALPQL